MTLAETIYHHGCVGGLPSFWQPTMQPSLTTCCVPETALQKSLGELI